MYKQYIYKNIKWLLLSIILMCLDISTKYWIKTHLFFGERLFIFPGMNFCYIYNSGLAFGIFSNVNMHYQWLFIIIIMLLIMIFIIMLLMLFKCSKYYHFSYSMIIGGALGNLFDRVLYGSVIDFIDIYISNWHWPAFNIADITIFLGIIILIIAQYNDGCFK